MTIKKLPEYLINRLKAWEIVERPASIIKEVIENSLDANATKISLNIIDWWKKLIQIEDNWHGIEHLDMDLVLERYATSKIQNEEDLDNIKQYWFRWEALASISEVSRTTIVSKTKESIIWTKINKINSEIIKKTVPTSFDQGTTITIEDLFFNVPARLKFLKSAQTEYFYCYNTFLDIAIHNRNKSFILKKNDKVALDLPEDKSILDRINKIYKKDYSKDLHEVRHETENIFLNWYVSNPNLRFWSGENIKFFVNWRPIQDKTLKRAVMDSYKRQITPWDYPFAIISLDINPEKVDVNVHPRKSEVKFLDTNQIYNLVLSNIQKVLWQNKITEIKQNFWNYSYKENYNKIDFYTSPNTVNHKIDWQKNKSESIFTKQDYWNFFQINHFDNSIKEDTIQNDVVWEYQIVWQIRDSYIVLQNSEKIFYIDQHALAERISFEKMKSQLDPQNKSNKISPKLLLQPISLEIPKIINIESKLEEINKLGFDCGLISDEKIIVYSVPKIFDDYKIDLVKLFYHIFYLDKISFDNILDKIFATKACKTSIKAWQKLSYEQIKNLIKDWFENIKWMFVCQHWRPFFVSIPKKEIDKRFDR